MSILLKNCNANTLAKALKDCYFIIDSYNADKITEGALVFISSTLMKNADINLMSLKDVYESISYITEKIVKSNKVAKAQGKEAITLKDYKSLPIDQMFIKILKEYKNRKDIDYSLVKLDLPKDFELKKTIENEFIGSFVKLDNHLNYYGYKGAFIAFIQFAQSNRGVYKTLEIIDFEKNHLNIIVEHNLNQCVIEQKNSGGEFIGNSFIKSEIKKVKKSNVDDSKEANIKRCKAGIIMYTKIKHIGVHELVKLDIFEDYKEKEYGKRKQ